MMRMPLMSYHQSWTGGQIILTESHKAAAFTASKLQHAASTFSLMEQWHLPHHWRLDVHCNQHLQPEQPIHRQKLPTCQTAPGLFPWLSLDDQKVHRRSDPVRNSTAAWDTYQLETWQNVAENWRTACIIQQNTKYNSDDNNNNTDTNVNVYVTVTTKATAELNKFIWWMHSVPCDCQPSFTAHQLGLWVCT